MRFRGHDIPVEYPTWDEVTRRKWVADYNASLPAINAKRVVDNERRMAKREADWMRYKDTPTPPGFQWLNTEIDPHKPAFGFDAGRTSWKFHAVMAGPKETFRQLEERSAASICGLLPKYGWTLDMFMDENDPVAGKCIRCLKRLAQFKSVAESSGK